MATNAQPQAQPRTQAQAQPTKTREQLIEELYGTDYCNEAHIQTFARALSSTSDYDHDAVTVPPSPSETRTQASTSASFNRDYLAPSSSSSSSSSRPGAYNFHHHHHHRAPGHANANANANVNANGSANVNASGQAAAAESSASGARRDNTNANPQRPVQYERVHKVSAVSDFAPIHTKVKRGTRRRPRPSIKKEPLYQIFRWPLLWLLNTIIALEFGLYVLIRQCVNAFEFLLAWRGPKRTLRAHLRQAKSWDEWKRAASVLDEFLGFNEWKRDEEDPYYDYVLVRKVRRSLRTLRERGDARGLLDMLEICARDNFAGTQSARLYAESFYGTKDSIEAFINEVERSLAYVRTTPDLSIEEKRRFYRSANRNLGASALCLSGGAAFGFYHFGVLKALLDANLMPRVFNGTSAGTLPAAFACTHTDEELKMLMGPRLADYISCFEEPYTTTIPRLWKTGALFDAVQWARKSTFFTRGSMTFREAYERTGKVLNISVIPADQHSPTKLLNYLTAPNCVIWSAAIASSAVPTVLNPVVLMQKTPNGDIVPWSWGVKFKDGSLRVDVPLQSLNLLFNVNYPIVSQVNPHIHLFWFAPRGSAGKPVAHRKGKGWRGGFLLSAAEQFLKLELTKNFKVIRDLELMPQMIGQDWSSVFLQRFDGSITIHPRIRMKDFFRMLTDPDRPNMERMQRGGELATWPTLHMIENRFRLEREIFRGRLAVRQATHGPEPGREFPLLDTDPVQPRLEAGLGAPIIDISHEPTSAPFPPGGPSVMSTSTAGSLSPPRNRGTSSPAGVAGSSRPMIPSEPTASNRTTSSQLAVESEAEEGFASRSPKFFRFPKLQRLHPRRDREREVGQEAESTDHQQQQQQQQRSYSPANNDSGREDSPEPADAPAGEESNGAGPSPSGLAASIGMVRRRSGQRSRGEGTSANRREADDHEGDDESPRGGTTPVSFRSRAGSQHTIRQQQQQQQHSGRSSPMASSRSVGGGSGASASGGVSLNTSSIFSSLQTRSRSLLDHFPRFNAPSTAASPPPLSEPPATQTPPRAPNGTSEDDESESSSSSSSNENDPDGGIGGVHLIMNSVSRHRGGADAWSSDESSESDTAFTNTGTYTGTNAETYTAGNSAVDGDGFGWGENRSHDGDRGEVGPGSGEVVETDAAVEFETMEPSPGGSTNAPGHDDTEQDRD